MSEPKIVVVDDPDAAAAEAAERIAATLAAAVRERGRADWATTGGTTPVGIYRRLRETSLFDQVPWEQIHVWWGDDRYVPRDHPLSNVQPFDDILVDIARASGEGSAGTLPPLPLPAANVHPFRTTEAIAGAHGAAWAAGAYAEELRASGIEVVDGWPVLDLVLLGVGGDGHILSVFPGSQAFDSDEWALAIPAPTHIEPHVERVTMNPAIVTAARTVLPVVYGPSKTAIVGEIFGPERDVRRWPAQLARRPGAVWVMDRVAAGRIPA